MAAAGFEVSVALEVDSFDVLSYAYSGTNRQVVTRIDVANTGSVGSAGTLVRPRVQVTSNLAGAPVAEWSGAAQALPAPGAPAIIWEDAGIVMNKALIDNLMQTPQAQLVVEILAGDALVSAIRRPLTVLQANQWQHTSDCIDALAGFVQVGDPALDVVLKSVNAILRKRTEFHESQGYSRDAEHVQQVASAVSDVLRDLKIEVTGPAFGTAGATYAIQPPTAILAGKRATALELALVAAACLEKAKLDPVIFLADNHVCAGYAVIPAQAKGSWDAGEQAKIWNKLAPEAVVRHPMALAKLLSLELVQVLDTVGAISDSGPPARTADGKQRHVDVDPAGLKAMLVVRKAWESGISFASVVPVTTVEKLLASTERNVDAPTVMNEVPQDVVEVPPVVSPVVPLVIPPVVPSLVPQKVPTEDAPVAPQTAEERGTIAEAMQVEPGIWFQISHWAKESQMLNPFQRSLAYSMGRLREAGKEPSIKQAKWALVLHKEAYNSGFTPG